MIPNKLRILGHDVAVKLVDQSEFGGEGQFGDFNTGFQQIRISNQYSESAQQETLIHEVVEYISSALELDMKHNQVQALSAALYQIISDNKPRE